MARPEQEQLDLQLRPEQEGKRMSPPPPLPSTTGGTGGTGRLRLACFSGSATGSSSPPLPHFARPNSASGSGDSMGLQWGSGSEGGENEWSAAQRQFERAQSKLRNRNGSSVGDGGRQLSDLPPRSPAASPGTASFTPPEGYDASVNGSMGRGSLDRTKWVDECEDGSAWEMVVARQQLSTAAPEQRPQQPSGQQRYRVPPWEKDGADWQCRLAERLKELELAHHAEEGYGDSDRRQATTGDSKRRSLRQAQRRRGAGGSGRGQRREPL